MCKGTIEWLPIVELPDEKHHILIHSKHPQGIQYQVIYANKEDGLYYQEHGATHFMYINTP